MNEFTRKAIELINKLPAGKVATYGQIARLAGNARAARRISRILHQYTRKYKLPWHRVVNSKGEISLRSEDGFAMQKSMLQAEGIEFKKNKIDLHKFGWKM